MDYRSSKLNFWRLVYSIPTWILSNFIIAPVLGILGWILVPLAAASKQYYKTHDAFKASKGENPNVYHFKSKYMFIWDNWEDGIANDTYYKAPNLFLQIIYWSCYRNPINSIRITPILSCKIDPTKVRYMGNLDDVTKYRTEIPHWFYAWQGLYSNFLCHFKVGKSLYRFWIGWKIFPSDIIKISYYRERGAGFTIQFKKIK